MELLDPVRHVRGWWTLRRIKPMPLFDDESEEDEMDDGLLKSLHAFASGDMETFRAIADVRHAEVEREKEERRERRDRRNHLLAWIGATAAVASIVLTAVLNAD